MTTTNALMKAPRLERQHLLALRTLLRMTFARAVRLKMEALQKTPGEHPAESTLKIITLTDMLADADQPLSITLAMMEMHNSNAAFLPLNDTRFDFYMKTLATEVGPDDFKGVPEEQLATLLEPLRLFQVELRQRFAEAMAINPQEILRAAGKGAQKVGQPVMPTGLMN